MLPGARPGAHRAQGPAVTNFVELWLYLSATPLFGLTATLGVYVLAHAAYTRLGQAPWANPVLWSVLVLALLLLATGTPYETYFSGAQFIHVLLGPAVVALAWPLWQRRAELRARPAALALAALAGGGAAVAVALGVGWALGLPVPLLASLAPKGSTAPVAMGVAATLGGEPALAAVFAVLTGLVGAVLAKPVLDALKLRRPEVRGFALGTAAHGLGAARAWQVHPAAGAYAALGLSLQVLLAALLLPLLLPPLLRLL
jgi:putative effector of murein hydrolase